MSNVIPNGNIKLLIINKAQLHY